MKESIANRLKAALDIREMKAAELSEISGVSKSRISQYIQGNYEPKQKAIHQLAIALNVNESWLMGYDVAIARKSTNKVSSKEIDNQLGDLLLKLNDIGKKEAIKRVEELTQIPKYKVHQHDLRAAHNDAEMTEEEIALMKQDLDEL